MLRFVFFLLLASANRDTPRISDDGPSQALDVLVHAYFQTEDVDGRESLAASIVREAGGSVERVASVVQRVRLWESVANRVGVFQTGAKPSERTSVRYKLPFAYDPGRRYPVVLCMPGKAGSSEAAIQEARLLLGEAAEGFLFVAADRLFTGAFHDSSHSRFVVRLMRDLRQRFHLDTDRVYLFGSGVGGDAAWAMALGHSHFFAGMVVVSAYLHVPYPVQVYPLLLANLRDLPILSVWSDEPVGLAYTRQRELLQHNRLMADAASREAVAFVGVELSRDSLDEFRLTDSQRAMVFEGRRRGPSRRLSHWFRFPTQGRGGWLSQTRFRGDPWMGDQLSILPSGEADHDAFITSVVKDRLAYLGAEVKGQTVTLDVRRCARVELLLPPGLLDLSRPITVFCNGKRRFRGVAEVGIATLLETAYDRWEFQRLAFAKVSFRVRPFVGRRRPGSR